MSVSTSVPPRSRIIYPEDDGQPMAENTLQFQWIVTIKEGLDRAFRDRSDVFVAGDLLWYPVEGEPEIRQAPDTMVVFGRPKGYRGSYMQWLEAGIAPQVVFEVLSPGNRPSNMIKKFQFYDRYGVQEYYIYDLDSFLLEGWMRVDDQLNEIAQMDGWVSPLLGVRFDMSQGELRLFDAAGRRFLTYAELAEERDQITQERDQIIQERDRIAQERDELLAKLKSLGVEPQP
ncbi:MAG: Uma2 family endonuclease [Isosphaeraceae bacterium]